MAGLDHSHLPPPEVRDPAAERHNARLGLVLFAVYLAAYGAFVLVNAFRPAVMDELVGAGVNWAVASGMALIAGALLWPSSTPPLPAAGGGPGVIYEPSALAVAVFGLFVAITLGLSFYLGRRTRPRPGYFAAGGGIHWFVNGVAFAGDYLSAASFLGICGMIAFYGYDGFLYSIGYLAGWVVALFVIAEPIKRLGRYTFADALDSQFHSRGIKLAAADQHAGRQHLLPDPADGRRRRRSSSRCSASRTGPACSSSARS